MDCYPDYFLHCGMSYVMVMPSFNISLYGPTSTSPQLSVAVKFTAGSGMILEFDNRTGDASDAPGMDLSWISRYGAQEDER